MLELLRRKSDGKVFLAVDDGDGGIACLVPLTIVGGHAAFELPLDEMYPGIMPISREDFERYPSLG
jgi:hypothetical protein